MLDISILAVLKELLLLKYTMSSLLAAFGLRRQDLTKNAAPRSNPRVPRVLHNWRPWRALAILTKLSLWCDNTLRPLTDFKARDMAYRAVTSVSRDD